MIWPVGESPWIISRDLCIFRKNSIDDIGLFLFVSVVGNGRERVGWCFVEDRLEKVKNFQKWGFQQMDEVF